MSASRALDILRWVTSFLAPVLAVLMASASIGMPAGTLPPAPDATPAIRSIERMAWFETAWHAEKSALDARILFTSNDLTEIPPLPSESGAGRRIVYSISDQRIWMVDAEERILDSYLVSGNRNKPGPGTYQVFSKSPWTRAFSGDITMRWMVRFTRTEITNIGFHDIPTYPGGIPMQTDEQFGTYRSAGCVRQPNDKARRLYEWADLGTPVVVTP